MGWTQQYTTRPAVDVVREQLIGDGSICKVVANSGAKYWVLENLSTGTRFGVVVIVRKTRDSITTKIVDESMGPYDHNFPLRFLDLLSPTDSEFAEMWRREVREHHAKKKAQPKVEPNDIIVFDEPLQFTGGFEAQRFRFIGRGRFVALIEGGYSCNVRFPRTWKTAYKWSVERQAVSA